jgi:hypothetical protein
MMIQIHRPLCWEKRLPKNKENIHPLAGPLLLLGLWVIFYFKVIFLNQTFVLMDASRVFYPLWKWQGEIYRNGFIPLWNFNDAFGTPALADPEMDAWYPFVPLFYLFLNPTTAFNTLILGHHLAALIGFWVLVRGRAFSFWPALAGSLVWGFAVPTVCLSWDPVMLFSLAWIPWVFWAGDQLLARTGKGWLFFPVFLAFQWSSGYPVFGYLTLLFLTLEKGGDFLISSRRDWTAMRRGALHFLIGILLAGGYCLAWGLPFFEFLKFSNLSLRLGMSQSLGLENLATWLNPFFNGHPFWGTLSVPYWLGTYFLGLPPLVLLLWFAIRNKENRLIFFLWLIALGLSLGGTIGLGEGFKRMVPLYHWVARSGYVLPLVTFWSALLVSQGMAFLEKWKFKNDLVWIIICLMVYGFALFLGVPMTLFSFWISALLLMLAGFSGGWFKRGRAILWLGAFLFSVAPVLQSLNFTLGRDYYDSPPPVLDQVEASARIYYTPDTLRGFEAVSGVGVKDVYEKLKQRLSPNWPLAYGMGECYANNPFFLWNGFRWNFSILGAPPEESGKILNYLGASIIVGDLRQPKLEPYEKDKNGISFFRNTSAFPRWFSVRQALVEKDWKGDLSLVAAPNFDFKSSCFIHDENQAGVYTPRTVLETDRKPGEIKLTARGNGRALLVSNETYYPGWKVFVDGKLRVCEEVNHGFAGLTLRNGESEVDLRYRPATFRLGAFLSLLAVGIWVALFTNLPPMRRMVHGRSRV